MLLDSAYRICIRISKMKILQFICVQAKPFLEVLMLQQCSLPEGSGLSESIVDEVQLAPEQSTL
jgi:hypothetical protein